MSAWMSISVATLRPSDGCRKLARDSSPEYAPRMRESASAVPCREPAEPDGGPYCTENQGRSRSFTGPDMNPNGHDQPE